MHWYLIHTKLRQEKTALLNLVQQGYECYLPLYSQEKIHKGNIGIFEEPLFPRYLFVRLNNDSSPKSWAPIRSTKGVSRLVTFGINPAQIDNQLVDSIRKREAKALKDIQRLFNPGERVTTTKGIFAGVDSIYEMCDGESRAMILIEWLSRPIRLRVTPTNLRKIG